MTSAQAPATTHTDDESPTTHTAEPVFSGGWWRNAVLWRTLTLGGILVTVLAVGAGASVYEMMNSHINDLTTRLTKVRHVNQLAVLTDAQTKAAVLVTLDAQRQPIKVQRLGNYQEDEGRSLQLWALPANGGAPRPWGVLERGNTLQRLDAEASALQGVASLAISLEPKGGVPPESGPTGPVLFKGALIPNL